MSKIASIYERNGKWLNSRKQETVIPNTFEEFGEMPQEHQGISGEIAEIYMLIKDGLSDTEIMELYPNEVYNVDKFERIRQRIKSDENSEIRREIETWYIWGKTGVGKTRYVLEKYGYRNVYRITDYKNPFDGYKGEDVICFDEFSSSLSIQNMNNLLDCYPLSLPARYSNKQACYTKIYIISNIKIEEQYEMVQYLHYEVYKAFLRRIKHILEFKEDGSIIEEEFKGGYYYGE